MIKLIIFIAKRFKPLDDFLSALFMASMAHNAKSELHKASIKRLLEKQANEEQSVQRPPDNEPPIHDITNEIMNPLNESATRIQRMVRSVRRRRNDADRQYREQISREFDENIARSRNEELQRQQDAINELDQILRQDITNKRNKSATTIQNAIRNRNA